MRDNFFEKYNVHPENQKIILEVISIMRLDGKTEVTLIAYGIVLRRFFTDVQKLTAEISYDDTLNWLEEKFGERNPKTYRHNFEVLKSFFKKCHRLGYIEKIPIKSWWNPKVGSSMPRYLTDKEISEVKVEAEDMPLRNRLMVELMLGTGCRVSELCKLK